MRFCSVAVFIFGICFLFFEVFVVWVFWSLTFISSRPLNLFCIGFMSLNLKWDFDHAGSGFVGWSYLLAYFLWSFLLWCWNYICTDLEEVRGAFLVFLSFLLILNVFFVSDFILVVWRRRCCWQVLICADFGCWR